MSSATSTARICTNCWQRRAAPGFTTCPPCFYLPARNRANAAWRHLIDAANTAHTTTRKAA